MRLIGQASLATLLALAASQAAQAQEGIWVRCELAPGQVYTGFGAFMGTTLIGNGLLRYYDETTRSLGENNCTLETLTSQYTLTEDEFVFDSRATADHWSGRIDRRTGVAFYALASTRNPAASGRVESVCRGIPDPRPPRAF